MDTRTALETLGMGLGWFCLGSLPSVRGLVRPEPMAREVRNKIGNPTRTMQFPKGPKDKCQLKSTNAQKSANK